MRRFFTTLLSLIFVTTLYVAGSSFAYASQDIVRTYGPFMPEHMPLEFVLGEKYFMLEVGDFLDKDGEVVGSNIYDSAPFINRVPLNAEVVMNEFGELQITAEKPGMRIDTRALEKSIEKAQKNYDFSVIELKYSFTPAHVKSADLEPVLSRLNEMMNRTLTLETEPGEGYAHGDRYTFNLRNHFDLLEVEFMSYFDFNGQRIPVSLMKQDKLADMLLKKDWVIGVNEQALDVYIRDELAADLEIPAQDVVISMELPEGMTLEGASDVIGEDGGNFAGAPEWMQHAKVTFDGTAQNGIVVNRGDLADSILRALNAPAEAEGRDLVRIPLEEVEALVHVPKALEDRGITELFSVGYSNFYGSSWKRIHNIKTGVARFNGVVIPQGSTFSFNERLGHVDGSTGYLEELVIKGDYTEPDYGGGLCQVSSTFFRAGLFGGLDVAERKAHSYAVSYYARPGGHGLDCTIYPGVADCKLVNDTPGDLLIQAYTDGSDAYFKFYGTTDGRTVAMDGPYYSNRVAAPPDKIVYDPSFPPDYEENKGEAHNGFDALWYRTVKRADGTEVTHTFTSRYQARPKITLRGGTEPVEGEEAEDGEMVAEG